MKRHDPDERPFRPDERPHARLFRGGVKARRAIDAVHIDKGDSRQILFGCLVNEILGK